MNERIKSIALECYNPYGNFDLEKFAELIMKDCGQWFNNRLVVEPDHGLPHRIERNQAVVGVMKEFKEHFGVEL